MAIPYDQQYYVEKERNDKFQWLILAVTFGLLVVHGLIFHWIPNYLRSKRSINHLKFIPYFKFIKYFSYINTCFKVPKFWKKKDHYYFQPSLLLLYLGYLAVNGVFAFAQTKDINYEPTTYIVGKRLGKLAIGNMPLIYLFVTKNDLISAISGLQHDRLVVFHKWIGRTIWMLSTAHLYLCATYWLNMDVKLMLEIPPQYFGMIAYASCCFLTWASLRWIRRIAFDVFLVQHRVFSFMMLLFSIFHNSQSRAGVIFAVHMLVVDRVVSRVLGIIHCRRSPTKGISRFETFDEDTLLVTLPIKMNKKQNPSLWYNCILPKYGTWKAGQHVLLNVPLVYKFQYHPFTIASLAETGEIKLLIRKQKGFTKHLVNKVLSLEQSNNEGDHKQTRFENIKAKFHSNAQNIIRKAEGILMSYMPERWHSSNAEECSYDLGEGKELVSMKATINGPYGANFQRLTSFDSILFLCAGSGGSFIFPVCLDFLIENEKRNAASDFFNRPEKCLVHLLWTIKEKQNIVWYKHIIDKLLPYILSGNLKLTIHISRYESDILTTNTSQTKSEGMQKNSDKTIEASFSECIDQREYSFQYAKIIMESGLVEFQHGRPDLKYEISSVSQDIIRNCDDSTSRSLAVMACGPNQFLSKVKTECQRNRRIKGSPDIYCYCESF